METRRSFCRICHAACPIEVDVEGSTVVAVRGVKDDPLFEGYTCVKGRHLPEQHADPHRVRGPLRRDGDGFVPVGLGQALDDIAATIGRIIAEHGPRAVATYIGTGGFQSSTAVATTRMWHRAVASPSFHTSITIDQPAKTTAPARIGWWDAGFHSFRSSDVSMALGYNSLVSSYAPQGGLQGTNPFVELRRAKARGMKLIVVDPRRTELASFADLHLQVLPGEDATLLAGLLHVVLRDGLHDVAFCEAHVDRLAELEAAVVPFPPAYVAERCGVTADEVVVAARLFAAGPRGIAGTGTGPGMSPRCSLTEHLVTALNVVCGRVNRAGDRINNPGILGGGRPFRAQVVAPRPEALTRGEPSRVRGLRGYRGQMPTNALADEILEPGEGRVRALVVIGGNPVVAWPDQRKTVDAMAALELLVVLDHRLTPTAEMAHFVLGSKLPLERADVTHIMDPWFEAPYANYTDAVVEPDGEVLNEWELIWELSRRMGTTVELPGGPLPIDRKPTDDEVIALAYATSRVPVGEIRRNGARIYDELEVVVEPAEPGASARFALAPPDIVAELAEVRAEASSAVVLSGFDPEVHTFRLVSRRLKAVLNSLGTEMPSIRSKGSTNLAYLHPDDLADLGAADGDLVEISSPRGTIVGVAAAADDLRRGVVSMAHSWGDGRLHDERVREIGTPTNRLVDNADGFDPITGQAVQSAIPVLVRPVRP
jgi:anaerobic selenocysteine-containing dehydrogenase